MSRPNSPVDICNLALDLLGQRNITSIESPSNDSEETCARWYDVVRRALLRKYVWNFAKKRVVLSRSGTPAFDWSDAYKLPGDYLRVLSIGGTIERDQNIRYDIEGDEILMNNSGANSVNFRYIADVTSPQEWDSLFTDLLPLVLALRIAYKYTLKKGLVSDLNGMLSIELPKAISVDGQERPPIRLQRSKYHQARIAMSHGSIADQYTVLD